MRSDNTVPAYKRVQGDYMLTKKELYDKFVKDFACKLQKQVKKNEYDKVIFFCVGTDRITGDSFRTHCWL